LSNNTIRSRPVARSCEKANARFDGYGVELFVDDDGDWLAHFAEMPNISAFGPTPEKALSELATAWRLVKEAYEREGGPVPVPPLRREYSGQFNVRIDKRVHRKLAIEAERNGLTLNALVAKKLAVSVED
jgi:predicted HicB family RNase H-like nuclease